MPERSVPRPVLFRAVLATLGLVQTLNGVYALFAPRSFYDDFPFDRGWVAALPAYNEHLVRDFGGLLLATGVLMLLAAIWLERRVVVAALLAWLLFAIPHSVFHALNLEPYGAADAIANMGGLVLMVLLPAGLLVLLARRRGVPRSALHPAAAASGGGGARIRMIERSGNAFVRLSYRMSRGESGAVIDPVRAFAHHPTLLAGYGALELAAERSRRVDPRLKELAVMKAAMLIGCEWCLDFGSAKIREYGVSEDELRDLVAHRESDRFSTLDKLVLDYAAAMSRTPVEVPDELFARLREHLDEAQLVELTATIALENFRARFNWALGIGSQGFSEGAYCVRPEQPAAARPGREASLRHTGSTAR